MGKCKQDQKKDGEDCPDLKIELEMNMRIINRVLGQNAQKQD